ncbi:eukaryotic translation initiation factor 4E [Trichonephila clavipes]|uniref:eIF-4F 25 kDa subunit n=1 Tax=Trichonephila clavipes TaxID=2585209 RepID=A0A8X6SW00_TRICX|nr:eukaryotic translation initiation factor 4E [Trichonephila clavipes]
MSTERTEEVENGITATTTEEVSPEMLIKHPLQNMWSLWFYKNDRTKSWEENLMEIITFDTVEDFWALYNHLEVVSKIPLGCDYALFKQGIKPMWEDVRNKQGGRWLLNVQKSQRNTDLNNYWLEILLCMIGEAFDESSDDVNGTVVQIRNKGDKLAVWTADVKHYDAIMKIGRTIKERLNLHPRNTIGYEAHADTQIKTGSAAKCRYTL